MKPSRSFFVFLAAAVLCFPLGAVAQPAVAPADEALLLNRAPAGEVEQPRVLTTGVVGPSIAYDLTNTVGCQTISGTTRATANVTNAVTFTASAAGSVLISYVTYLNIGSSPASARRTGVFHACEIENLSTQTITACPNDRFNLSYQASRGGAGTETAQWWATNEATLAYWWPGVSSSVPAQTFVTGLTPGTQYQVRLGAYRQLVSTGSSTFASTTACVSSAVLQF